jgi:hypothetical protein
VPSTIIVRNCFLAVPASKKDLTMFFFFSFFSRFLQFFFSSHAGSGAWDGTPQIIKQRAVHSIVGICVEHVLWDFILQNQTQHAGPAAVVLPTKVIQWATLIF